MKAFAAVICLFVIVVAQASAKNIRAPAKAEPPVDCDVDSDENGWSILLPNPVDCNSYYVCNGGLPILMPCPEGLEFNPEIMVCDWPTGICKHN